MIPGGWTRGRTGRRVGLLALSLLALLPGCGDEGPAGAPGSVIATLVSPAGAEGAVLLQVFGPGIRNVSAMDGDLYDRVRGDTVKVAIFRDSPGPIRFVVELADTAQRPTAVVLEVAGPDNDLRANLSAYTVRGLR